MPDVNVLIYTINPDARQHAPARRWLEDAYRSVAGVGFAWAALTGFVRLSTLRGILAKPLSVVDAMQFANEWLSPPHAHLLTPGDRHAALLGRLLLGAGRGGNLVGDARLAAIAIEHGAILGSFDTDFERFAGLQFDHLAPDAVHEDPVAHLKGSVARFDAPLSPADSTWHADARPAQRHRQTKHRR